MVTIFQEPVSTGINNGFHFPPGHKGEDHPAAIGTPIHAIADGKVVAVGYARTASAVVLYYNYGNWVLIKHVNGVYSLYGHMNDHVIRSGKVKRGQTIGHVGRTGGTIAQPVTGPHVHLSMMKHWYRNDPVRCGLFKPSSYISARSESRVTSLRKAVDSLYIKYIKHVSRVPGRRDYWVGKLINGSASEAGIVRYLKSTAEYKRLQKKPKPKPPVTPPTPPTPPVTPTPPVDPTPPTTTP